MSNECKICKQTTRVLDARTRTYYKCTCCGFISLDFRHMLDEVAEKKHYRKHENSFEHTGYVKMFQLFLEEVLPAIQKKPKTALEFGCGFAPVLASLLEQENIETDKYDLFFYPQKIYENKKYELITSTEVFEHLKNPVEVLQTLSNALKENGHIAIMSRFSPKSDKDFLDWWYPRDPTHISFFTIKSFAEMAKLTDLKLVSTINDNIAILKKQ